MEQRNPLNGNEIGAIIYQCLEGVVPAEQIQVYGSHNYQTGMMAVNAMLEEPYGRAQEAIQAALQPYVPQEDIVVYPSRSINTGRSCVVIAVVMHSFEQLFPDRC